MRNKFNVVALAKETGERFVIFFDESSLVAVLQLVCRWAADPDLDFSWYDAAILGRRARRLLETIRLDGEGTAE